MDILYIIGIFVSIFLTLLIVFKKNKALSDLFLGLFFILAGINISFSYIELINQKLDYKYPWAINITAPIVILYGTVIWFYIKSLTTIDFKFKPIYLLHLLPFLAFFLNHYINFYSIPASERIQIAITESFKQTYSYKFFVLFVALTTAFYLIWSLQLIHKHQQNIQKYFSNTDRIDLYWLKHLIYGLIVTFSITMGVIVLDLIFQFISFKVFEFGAFGLTSLFVIFLGFIGIRQTTIFSNITSTSTKYSELNQNELYLKLIEVMKTEKPYLDSEINIRKLSEKLKVNTDVLSKLLNEQLNKNFYEFINLYRIEAFKEKVLNPENNQYTLLAIAFDCGFSSKASFNRVFKKYTNYTPAEFKTRYQKN